MGVLGQLFLYGVRRQTGQEASIQMGEGKPFSYPLIYRTLVGGAQLQLIVLVAVLVVDVLLALVVCVAGIPAKAVL